MKTETTELQSIYDMVQKELGPACKNKYPFAWEMSVGTKDIDIKVQFRCAFFRNPIYRIQYSSLKSFRTVVLKKRPSESEAKFAITCANELKEELKYRIDKANNEAKKNKINELFAIRIQGLTSQSGLNKDTVRQLVNNHVFLPIREEDGVDICKSSTNKERPFRVMMNLDLTEQELKMYLSFVKEIKYEFEKNSN